MGVRYREFQRKEESVMSFYLEAQLAVLAARAGGKVDKDSVLGQAQERLKIRQSDRDLVRKIKSVDKRH